MDKVIIDTLSQLKLGQPQQHKNMTLIPLFATSKDGPEYITMTEALTQEVLLITEVSAGGAVPEVKVVNNAALPVLLLDSEELAGAKQNRVLNTTILIKERSETVIPVSCTERGRWLYTSGTFADSGHISPSKMRLSKHRSVTDSLKSEAGYRSDQGEVWEEVSEMMHATMIASPTSSMRDVYMAKRRDLEDYLQAFKQQPGQRGVLVLVNGEAAGLDIISSEEAYKILHAKLVKSYAIDAMLEQGKPRGGKALDTAQGFLKSLVDCQEEKFESVGYGWDHRFEQGEIAGSALTYQDEVIHMAFFKMTEGHKARLSRFRPRRGPRRPGPGNEPQIRG